MGKKQIVGRKSLKIFLNVVKILVTLFALYWVSQKVDLQDLKEALIDSNPVFLFLAFLAYCCSQVVASSRLNGFFKGIGLNISERYNFKLYLLGLFYNLFLPGGIGGDGYKLYFLNKKFGVGSRKLFSAIFFDRLSGLWALSLIVSALVIFIPQLNIPNWVPVVVVCVGTIIYYLILKIFFKVFIPNFFISHIKAIGSWSFQIISVILLLYALDFEGKFSPYLFSFLISTLVVIVPFSLGGFGIREMVNVEGAEFFNLDTHTAVLISLLFYFISAALALLGSYFILRPKGLGEDRLPNVSEVEDALAEASNEEINNNQQIN